jgi:hypothetical protein
MAQEDLSLPFTSIRRMACMADNHSSTSDKKVGKPEQKKKKTIAPL